MTKEPRSRKPFYYMDGCQGGHPIEIDDPAGFRLGQLIATAAILVLALLVYCLVDWITVKSVPGHSSRFGTQPDISGLP